MFFEVGALLGGCFWAPRRGCTALCSAYLPSRGPAPKRSVSWSPTLPTTRCSGLGPSSGTFGASCPSWQPRGQVSAPCASAVQASSTPRWQRPRTSCISPCCRPCSAGTSSSSLRIQSGLPGHPGPPCAAEFLATGQSAGEIAAAVIFGLLIPLALVAVSFWLVYKHLTMAVRVAASLKAAAGNQVPAALQDGPVLCSK